MITEEDGAIDPRAQMQREMDANGKLDLEEASAAAVAGAGLTMQDKSKAAMERVKNTLDKTENVAVDIKF